MLPVFCLGVVGILSKQSAACIRTANGIFRQHEAAVVFLVKQLKWDFSVVSELQRVHILTTSEIKPLKKVDLWHMEQ